MKLRSDNVSDNSCMGLNEKCLFPHAFVYIKWERVVAIYRHCACMQVSFFHSRFRIVFHFYLCHFLILWLWSPFCVFHYRLLTAFVNCSTLLIVMLLLWHGARHRIWKETRNLQMCAFLRLDRTECHHSMTENSAKHISFQDFMLSKTWTGRTLFFHEPESSLAR